MTPNDKKQDAVFLLTLIDFLIQVIFFGMFAFAVYSAAKDPRVEWLTELLRNRFSALTSLEIEKALDAWGKVGPEEIAKGLKAKDDLEKLQRASGISNIVELTDLLTKMAPVKDLKGTVDVITKAGGAERVQAAVDYYNARGPGKPHCITRPGTSTAVPIATLAGYEDRIEVVTSTTQFSEVVKLIGLREDDVRQLPLREFSHTFAKLGVVNPTCKYTFVLLEKTRYVEPRDAANALGNVYVWARKG